MNLFNFYIGIACTMSFPEAQDVCNAQYECGGKLWEPEDLTSLNEGMTIYPNPVISGQSINISLSAQHSITHLYVYDVHGRLRLTEAVSPGMEQWQLSTLGLSDGVYFLQIQNGEEFSIHKVIVE